MTDYEDEMGAAQKGVSLLQNKMRLLWGILRTMKENGWNEDLNAVDWLTRMFDEREKSEREISWLEREKTATDCLDRARELTQELEDVLYNRTSRDKIMHYGPQLHLNEAQDLLVKINNNIKAIYDARQGLTK